MATPGFALQMQCVGHEILAAHMKHKDMSIRDLAWDVERRLRKMDRNASYKKSSIGHLRSGSQKFCTRLAAWAIEDALDLPRGTLFVERVSNVSTDRRTA